MTRVRTGSRLHFGLLDIGTPSSASNIGGLGMMIDRPALEVEASPASTWSAHGPLAERALAIALRVAQDLPEAPPLRIVVHAAPPEHVGLGAGTQLSLATARAVATAHGANLDIIELARRTGRGKRSAIGIHGFDLGGFLVAGAKTSLDRVADLVARLEFPDPWRLIVVLPAPLTGLHGDREIAAFEQLAKDRARHDLTEISRLVMSGIVPALRDGNIDAFGAALHDYNRRVGEAFAPVQGGPYSHHLVAELVAFAQAQGMKSAGQSSWGPAVFAMAEDQDRADFFARQIHRRFGLSHDAIWIARARNRGAEVS
jgi:beta-RFAP synthase